MIWQRFKFSLILILMFYSCNNSYQIANNNKNAANRQYIKIKVNDSIEANVVYDTGADGLYLDSLFVDKNKITGFSTFAKLGGVGASIQTIHVLRGNFNYGLESNFSISTDFIPIVNFKGLFGKNIDGVVGNDLFDNKYVKVDYSKNKKITISHSLPKDVKTYESFVLTKRNNRFYYPLKVYLKDGILIEGDFLIDTGFGGMIGLTNDMYQRSIDNKEISFQNIPSQSMDLGGISSSIYIRMDSVSVGTNTVVKNKYIWYSLDKSGAMSKRDYVGILGGGFFREFEVIFDFLDNVMYLKKKQNYFFKDHELTKLVFDCIDRCDINQGFIVNKVYGNISPIRIGDSILSIDGKNVEDIDLESFLTNVSVDRKYVFLIKRKGKIININIVTRSYYL